MTQSVAIRGEPLSNLSCRFVVDRAISPDGAFFFPNRAKAVGSPLAESLLAIEGIKSVLIARDHVTVNKTSDVEWPLIGKQIGATIREHLATGRPAVAPQLKSSLPPADELRHRVQEVLDRDINPALAGHGGVCHLVDVAGNNVYVQLGGGCQGCGSALMALRHTVETAIRAAVPEVGEILEQSDHASASRR